MFFGIQDALNTVWSVPPKPPRTLWRSIVGLFQDRAVSFLMVLASGGILTLSLAISTLLAALDPLLRILQPQSAAWLNLIDLGVSFAIVTALFAVVYRVLPETRIAWRHVWLGALCAALLFTLGKFVLETVSELQQRPHGVWRGQFVCGAADLDLLFRADFLVWRRSRAGDRPIEEGLALQSNEFRPIFSCLTIGRYVV